MRLSYDDGEISARRAILISLGIKARGIASLFGEKVADFLQPNLAAQLKEKRVAKDIVMRRIANGEIPTKHGRDKKLLDRLNREIEAIQKKLANR